jgi:hypothetical protein
VSLSIDQIAGQVVDRRNRVELRAGLGAGEQLAVTRRDAADVLHHVSKPRRDAHGPLWLNARPQAAEHLEREATTTRRDMHRRVRRSELCT